MEYLANEPTQGHRVEPVDPTELSIDEQFVHLAQELLDKRIDQATYDRLVANLRELQPRAIWDSANGVQYATPRPKQPVNLSVLKNTFLIFCIAVVALVFVSIAAQLLASRRHILTASIIARTDVNNIATALNAFRSDYGRYPTAFEGLSTLVSQPNWIGSNWYGPYLKYLPNDPWGRPYTYRIPNIQTDARYDLRSNGPDGIPDTVDDISN